MSDIGKIRLDFHVTTTGDPKFLLVHDFSEWRVIENLPANLEIVVPGSRKPIIKLFKKNATNGLNSLNLGLSNHVDCEENYLDLPDGIYEFCLKGGAEGKHIKSRYFLKKDLFQLSFDKMRTKLGLEYNIYDKEYREDLVTIDILSEAASSATRRGEIEKAKSYFEQASSLLKAYKECKDCI